MRRARPKGVGAAALIASLLSTTAASAERFRAADSARAAAAASLEQAKRAFHDGVTLLDAGDVERALELFLQSRAAHPSGKNTANAAICLDRLQRFDEALEMYEELLTRFPQDLDDEDRRAVAPAMAALRGKVANLEVTSNVEGTLFVDGRPRGRLPRTTPVRVLAGERRIRVTKDGYAPFERRVASEVGATSRLDAILAPLRGVGILRMEDETNAGADVYVDGHRVGQIPHEGPLAPGRHVVWTRRDDWGSTPSAVVIAEGQTTLARVASARLGATIELVSRPPSARLFVNETEVGTRRWQGRLPVGEHRVHAEEEGYRAHHATISVPPEGPPIRVVLEPAVDRHHPRWPKPAPGAIVLGGFAGWAFGPTLGADAETSCPERCDGNPFVSGWALGARAGYEWTWRGAVELTLGYASVGTRFRADSTTTFTDQGQPHDGRYRLDHDLEVQGVLVAGGVSHRVPLAPRFAVAGRVAVGVLVATSSDPIDGTLTAGGETARVATSSNRETRSAVPVALPEVGAELSLGRVRVGLGLGALWLVGSAPAPARGRFGVADPCDPSAPAGAASCAPESTALDGQRAYASPFLFHPNVSAALAL